MKRRSKAIGASAIILIATILAAVVLFAALQTALTTESAHNEQNPLWVQAQPIVQARLRQDATAGNPTFRVESAMNGTDPEARHLWATYDTDNYAPLNPVQGSTYVIINVTVADTMNRTSPFSYSDVVLVGNDGRSYYANYAVANANCSAPSPQSGSSPAARATSTSRFLFLTTLRRRRLRTRHQTPR